MSALQGGSQTSWTSADATPGSARIRPRASAAIAGPMPQPGAVSVIFTVTWTGPPRRPPRRRRGQGQVVDEAEVDDVHRDLRVVALPQRPPDVLLARRVPSRRPSARRRSAGASRPRASASSAAIRKRPPTVGACTVKRAAEGLDEVDRGPLGEHGAVAARDPHRGAVAAEEDRGRPRHDALPRRRRDGPQADEDDDDGGDLEERPGSVGAGGAPLEPDVLAPERAEDPPERGEGLGRAEDLPLLGGVRRAGEEPGERRGSPGRSRRRSSRRARSARRVPARGRGRRRKGRGASSRCR